MLVLSRKSQESVIVGGFERIIKITVLEVKGGKVRLGFEADDSVPIHREEIWKKQQEG